MPESVASTESDDGMTEVIALVNKLQDVVSAANLPPEILDLPQMAVVGEQSAGKSSVLENIVGRDFLPRGTGIVTRCPLVLQLIHTKEEDYAEFLHAKGRRFTNYEEVKKEIEAQTERMAGDKKAISEQPINLKIHSPNVPHLTLVDLPGLAKNPVGDQPANIEEIIRKLILSYIKQENTLILAVTTATQDLANSDALQLAQSVDPERLRTIGIITKLDLMDQGTDARNILLNKAIPLRRGYIGLVNRSQQSIEKNEDIRIAQRRERRFYETHKAYRDIVDKMGSKYLRERLSEQLCQHIKDRLPTMRAQVRKENHNVKKSLEAMNAFNKTMDENWQQAKIVELIQKFSEEFHKQLEGQAVDVNGQNLSGGAKLNDCFYTQIYPLLNQAVVIDKRELFTLWRNMVGFNNMMFFTQQAFNNIVKKLLQQYKEPLEISTSLAANIVKESVSNSMHKVDAYPYLTQEVIRLMTEVITQNEEVTKIQLSNHLKAQKAFINNYHPDFMKQKELTSSTPPMDQVSNHSDPATLHRANSAETFVEDNMSVIGDEYFNKRNAIYRSRVSVHELTSRQYFFVLTSDKLGWFRDEMDNTPKGQVTVDGLQLTLNKGKGNRKKYNIQKTGGRRRRDNLKMTISFPSLEDEDNWLEAFRTVGVVLSIQDGPLPPDVRPNEPTWHVTPESSRKTTSTAGNQSSNQSLVSTPAHMVPVKKDSDPRTDFGNDPVLGEVATKLESYMRIIDETVHDLTPKYISYFLIYKTLKYTRLKLLSDVQKEDKENLMRMSDEEMSKQEEYFRIYNTTKDALKIMGEVSNAGREKTKKSKPTKPRRREPEPESDEYDED